MMKLMQHPIHSNGINIGIGIDIIIDIAFGIGISQDF